MLIKKIDNPKELEKLAIELEKNTAEAKANRIDKPTYFENNLKIFRKMQKYKMDYKDEKQLKKAIKLAKTSLKVMGLLGKASVKIADTREKLKKKKDQTLKRVGLKK